MSQELRTFPLPGTHVLVGHLWQNTRLCPVHLPVITDSNATSCRNPLRTVHESFPSHGSSSYKRPWVGRAVSHPLHDFTILACCHHARFLDQRAHQPVLPPPSSAFPLQGSLSSFLVTSHQDWKSARFRVGSCRCVHISIPIHSVTEWLSLLPPSHAHSSINVPCGSLSRSHGGNFGFTTFRTSTRMG